jgi:flavin reductase (DIM6/NTAB) family NADH-FMN oxidoreductase RutF
VPYGTHTIFIGEAEAVHVHDPIEPLIYQDSKYCSSVAHDAPAPDVTRAKACTVNH